MGIEVALVDESGRRLTSVRDVHDLVDRALAEASKGSQVLRFVDPYGDTTFNRLQMGAFLEDWASIEKLLASEHDRRAWTEVADLARRCETEPHVYLRFVGD